MPRDFLTFPMKEDRVRQYVGRGRIFWLLIDGCLSIFHFRRQASKNFIHEHDRCTTLLNDATGSASVLMLQLPSERLTMWKVSIRQSCSWQWSNRARSTYENIDVHYRLYSTFRGLLRKPFVCLHDWRTGYTPASSKCRHQAVEGYKGISFAVRQAWRSPCCLFLRWLEFQERTRFWFTNRFAYHLRHQTRSHGTD